MWLEANSNSYGYGKRSDIGKEITFDKFGSRRNYLSPNPQVCLSPSRFLNENSGECKEEIPLQLEQILLDTPLSDKKEIIGGKKSDVGVMIFTGCKKKLFSHPESQIELESPSLNNEDSEIQKKLSLNSDIDESDMGKNIKYLENRAKGRRRFLTERLQISLT